MRGLVATNVNADGSVQVRLRPGGVLLAFGPPERTVADDGVRCTYPIVNGFLVRTAGGTISFSRGPVRHSRSPPRSRVSSRASPPLRGDLVDRRALRAGAAPPPPGRLEALLPCPSRRRAGVKVVVFGATGTIGAVLVTVLAGDHDVTAVSRSPDESRDEHGLRWVRADVEDEQSVARAMEGAEVAYYLVHSLGKAGFEERERRSADGFARAAEKAGLRQIVYLGGLGDDADDLSPHLRSRRETEQRLAAGTVPVTTLRAGMVIGRGSAAFETIAVLVDRLPAMILPRWAKTPTQPIALVDAVRYLAGVCGNENALAQTYDVGGPEVMSYAEMIRRVGRIKGRTPPARGAASDAVALSPGSSS